MTNPPKQFFSRRNILPTVAVVILVYALTWALVLTGQKMHDNRVKHAAVVQQKQFDSQSADQKSIIKAQEYLKSYIGRVGIEQRLFLDYLQRKFNLDPSLSATQNPFQVREDPQTYPQEVNFLTRISYPDKIVTVAPRSIVDGPALTNIYSANCDHMALPTNFWPTMEQNYQAGGYSMTHVALALAFMKDNGCQIPPSHADLKPKVIEAMTKLAGTPSTSADLRYEAIAFLGLSDAADHIENKWIEAIATDQKPGGSWVDGNDVQNSDHTTILALWALLEYTHPNMPYEPLIHRSTHGS